jgi:transposase
MKQMTPAAVERAMKLQDVMLRAMAKRITWYQAAEILGISGRQMLRWQTRFKQEGYEGLFDRRRGSPSPRRVPLQTVEKMCRKNVLTPSTNRRRRLFALTGDCRNRSLEPLRSLIKEKRFT